MSGPGFSEDDLERIEASGSAAAIPELVRTIREYQRELDSLRMKADVAARDRDELRSALLSCQERLLGRDPG